ncbi:MAG: penicillin-binding transpeptidase domain-containing protein [Clostridiales bacterium]|nr:penicillin-binding transpeptidase domain-containing protein [Clostridiales bacterium]
MNEVKNRKSRQSNNVKRRVKQPKKNIAKIGIKTKIFAFLLVVVAIIMIYSNFSSPARVIRAFYKNVNNHKYEELYNLVETDMSKEEFTNKMKSVYDGMEVSSAWVTISINLKNSDVVNLKYVTNLNTVAGKLTFSNKSTLVKVNGKYKIKWDNSFLYPKLKNNQKIRVSTLKAKRGAIYDRNKNILAKDAKAYSIGIVAGKIKSDDDLRAISKLLNITYKDIKAELAKPYVVDGTFVHLKNIDREQQELKTALLKIPAVKIIDYDIREYPYNEKLSTLLGFVQNDDGKSGLELTFNSQLKGLNGCEIYVDDDGINVDTILKKDRVNGKNIDLTIDVKLQELIYEKFKDVESATVAMNYTTGEILALVSTPSYETNKISLGISDNEWNEIVNNKKKPLFTRFLSKYTPGSTMKPIVAAIGLDTDSFTDTENFGKSVKSWQKDSSWKDFYVTTLEVYNGESNLEKALIHSDNVYFAKAALKIGKSLFKQELDRYGFNKPLNFEQNTDISVYGNIDSEAKLAVSGFGQGEMEVNPIFMAKIYSAFANNGNAVTPYILQKGGNNQNTVNSVNLIKPLNANKIKNDLKKVIDEGTGKLAKIDGKNLYGKTGTAEIKMTKDDKSGEEIGWFNVFDDNRLLIVNMVENAKKLNGSKFSVKNLREVFDKYVIINNVN